MSGDAGIPVEQEHISEARFEEVSRQVKRWLTDHSQEGKEDDEIKGFIPDDLFDGFKDFGEWRAPSGKIYKIKSTSDDAGDTSTMEVTVGSYKEGIERFDYYNDGEDNYLRYVKGILNETRSFRRGGGSFTFEKVGFYGHHNVSFSPLFNFPLYGMDSRRVLQNNDVEQVDVFQTFSDMITDLGQATKVDNPS